MTREPSGAGVGLLLACVGLCEPSGAFVSQPWPSLGCVGLRGVNVGVVAVMGLPGLCMSLEQFSSGGGSGDGGGGGNGVVPVYSPVNRNKM